MHVMVNGIMKKEIEETIEFIGTPTPIPNLLVGKSDTCTYCGDYFEMQIDHVIPYSFIGIHYGKRNSYRSLQEGLTCYSCSDCNQLLSSSIFWSFEERYWHVRRIVYRKNAKIYRRPQWKEEDIKSLDYTLQSFIRHQSTIQDAAVARLDWDGSKKMIKLVSIINSQVNDSNSEWTKGFFESWIKKYL